MQPKIWTLSNTDAGTTSNLASDYNSQGGTTYLLQYDSSAKKARLSLISGTDAVTDVSA